jgi:hypothetical protein
MKLPVVFNFKRTQHDRDFNEHRLNLGFLWYGTTITIYQLLLWKDVQKVHSCSEDLSNPSARASGPRVGSGLSLQRHSKKLSWQSVKSRRSGRIC